MEDLTKNPDQDDRIIVITKDLSVPAILYLIADKGQRNNELIIQYCCDSMPITSKATQILNYMRFSFGWFEAERIKERLKKKDYETQIWIVRVKKDPAWIR